MKIGVGREALRRSDIAAKIVSGDKEASLGANEPFFWIDDGLPAGLCFEWKKVEKNRKRKEKEKSRKRNERENDGSTSKPPERVSPSYYGQVGIFRRQAFQENLWLGHSLDRHEQCSSFYLEPGLLSF